jgi:hypothetical protein
MTMKHLVLLFGVATLGSMSFPKPADAASPVGPCNECVSGIFGRSSQKMLPRRRTQVFLIQRVTAPREHACAIEGVTNVIDVGLVEVRSQPNVQEIHHVASRGYTDIERDRLRANNWNGFADAERRRINTTMLARTEASCRAEWQMPRRPELGYSDAR